MSDNRFDQNHGSGDDPDDGSGEDEFDGGEKTQLVDLDSLQAQGESEPQFAPPPTMDSTDSSITAPPPADDDFDAGGKTEMFDVPPSMQDDSDDAITSSAPAYGDDSFDKPAAGSANNSGAVGGNMSSVDTDDASVGGGVTSSADQVYVDSEKPGDDGATQFINVSDFADKEEAHFTPEQQEAGYDGSTQFVDVNALQAGDQGAGGDPIENDKDLHRGYQFGPDDIHRGEITLIEARNPLGKKVLLKRIWEGTPDQMSTPLRERIAQLHEFKHPGLVAMNGMFVSDSGMWIEIDAPIGQRLTEILQQNGAMPVETVVEWMASIGEVIEAIHAQQLAYANLTTDSIWIQNDGTVQLEPFDMLRLEERGNLGVFGPPEMNAPPDERNLSPATDVYSMAAVTAAAITGLPLRPENLENHDDNGLVKVLYRALDDSPDDRPQSATEFVEELQGGDGLDIKLVGGAVFAVLLLGVGVLAMVVDDDDQTTPPLEEPQNHAEAPPSGDEPIADEPGGQEPSGEDDAPRSADGQPTVDLPGAVTVDPRLDIETSYQLNPPADARATSTEQQRDEWRDQADDFRREAEDAASDSDAFDAYAQALERLTLILETQDDPSSEDRQAWSEIYDEQVVQYEVNDLLERIEEGLLEGRVATTNRRYVQLSRIDPNATADIFMSEHNSGDIVELQRVGAEDDDE